MRLGVLISGRGSNLRALVAAVREGRIDAEVALVLSNRETAPGLAWARAEVLPTACLDERLFAHREEHDLAVLSALGAHGVDLVCLAGYMRLVGPSLVHAYRERMLNVHPSLLPAFPGRDAQRQAWEHGVKVTGATVHLVDEQLDHGPILLQEVVRVEENDSVDTLTEKILRLEHVIYPLAVAGLCAGRIRVDGRRVHLAGGPA